MFYKLDSQVGASPATGMSRAVWEMVMGPDVRLRALVAVPVPCLHWAKIICMDLICTKFVVFRYFMITAVNSF